MLAFFQATSGQSATPNVQGFSCKLQATVEC